MTRSSLLRQRRALDEHAELGVGARRARVEVHRADEDDLLVDHRRLGVQAAERRAEHAEALGLLGARRAQLVEIDAGLEHARAIARVAGVDERLVGGGERVRDHRDLDLVALEVAERLHAGLAGDHVRRGQHEIALGLPDLHHHVVGDAHLEGDLRRHREQLLGRIGEGAGDAPLEPELAGVELLDERAVAEQVGRGRIDRRRGRQGRHRRIERLGARDLVAERLAHGLDRIDDLAVPVAVEDLRHRLDHRAHHERVHVDEVRALRAQEVLVGDVATARHRHHAVGDEELVVHAVVEPAEVEDRRRVAAADAARAVAAERVEEAHLDVGERRQAAQQRIRMGRVEVVDEEADADAAHARVAQGLHQQAPGRVVLEHVVLHVERRRRALRELDPRVERVGAERQQANAGLLGRGRRDLRDLDQRAVGVGRQRQRVGLADVGGQRAAAGEHRRDGDQRGRGEARQRAAPAADSAGRIRLARPFVPGVVRPFLVR